MAGLLVMDPVGLVLFLGVHTLTTQRELRARLIASTGEGGYKIGYAIASIAGLALIVWGFAHYRATGWIGVWTPPTALKHVTVALMLPAVILVVAAYIRGRIYTAVKHPMLTGIKLWAAAHSARQWRSRLDHPVWLVPGMGSVRPDFAETPHGCRQSADPGRRAGQRPDRGGGRDRRLSGAGFRVPSRRDRRSRRRSLSWHGLVAPSDLPHAVRGTVWGPHGAGLLRAARQHLVDGVGCGFEKSGRRGAGLR